MLTMFTIPKAFRGDFDIIQKNAIRSWTLLRPECEIILFGNEEGTAEMAGELGIRHIPDVECNEYGTPLMDSVFSQAHDAASHELMCFINTDIILTSDFLPALQRVHNNEFLMVGLRWDLDVNEPIDFENAWWEILLTDRMKEHGKLHPPGGGGDYFIFPRGLFEHIPPFAIGRTAWDNWFIYRGRELKIPVIDATRAFTNVHQYHDYSHHPDGTAGVWEGPERTRNIELAGGEDRLFDLRNATWILTGQDMKRALSLGHIYFRMRTTPILHPRLGFLLPLFKIFERLVMVTRSVMGR